MDVTSLNFQIIMLITCTDGRKVFPIVSLKDWLAILVYNVKKVLAILDFDFTIQLLIGTFLTPTCSHTAKWKSARCLFFVMQLTTHTDEQMEGISNFPSSLRDGRQVVA